MLESCDASTRPVRIKAPHFRVFPEFEGTSYAKRYELFCRKLVLERLYTSTSFITSRRDSGINGDYQEPNRELSPANFLKALDGHVRGAI